MILGKTLYKRLLMDTNKSSGKPEGRTLGWLSSWSSERFGGGGGMQPPYQEIGFNRVWATCGSPACDGYFRWLRFSYLSSLVCLSKVITRTGESSRYD